MSTRSVATHGGTVDWVLKTTDRVWSAGAVNELNPKTLLDN
jgi:hypothetical protein